MARRKDIPAHAGTGGAMAARSGTGPCGCGSRGSALALLILLALSGGCASVRPCGNLDVGFLGSRDTSPEGAARCRAAGPVFERQTAADGHQFMGVRPFYSLSVDTGRERRLYEVLWPVATVKHLGRESNWRFLTAYGEDFDNRDPDSRYRGMVFPFVFWGRDKEDTSYFSIFPLGGTLNEFLGRDRIVFALFPLYAHSMVDNTETWDFLWPIVSRTRSDDVSRFRVFPFYGKSVDEGTYTKQFVLWPFWTHARYETPGHSGSSYVLFPLYGRTRMDDQAGWTVLPPFFRWAQSEKLTMLNAPWPFFQYVRGDYDKLYVWPLWGRRAYGVNRTSFLLWPFVHTSHTERRDTINDRLAVLPFVYSERVSERAAPAASAEKNAAPAGVVARYFKLWPLVSYQREDGTARVRLLELWPLKNTGPIERNMTPFWTLYTRITRPDFVEHELLWGLFRYRRDGEESRHVSLFPLYSTSRCDAAATRGQWSFLLGLLGHEREEARSTWRVLWFLKFGD